MLRSLKEIKGYRLTSVDGWSGRVHDFLFDDVFWSIRYLVADTGRLLPGRKVLISPLLLEEPDWGNQALPVRLTKDEVRQGPGLDEDEPVARQMERKFEQERHWPMLWATSETFAMGRAAIPEQMLEQAQGAQPAEPQGDPHLRSMREVTGYDIQARDGSIGDVHDMIAEVRTWIVRYLVVDTRKWLPGGKKVLLSPAWIDRLTWSEQDVVVAIDRDQVERAPEYDPGQPVNRKYEARLYDFYGRPIYWNEEEERVGAP